MPLTEAEELELLELENENALALKSRSPSTPVATPEKTTFGERLTDPKKRTPFGLPENISSAVFPTTTETIKQKKGAGGTLLEGVVGGLEALGTPTRIMGTIRTDPETGEQFKASDPESALLRPEIDKTKKLIEEKVQPRDPNEFALTPRITTPEQQEQDVEKFLKGGAELVGNILSDPSTILSPFAKIAQKGVSFGNKLLGRFAQELSGVSEEALRKAGTKAGREALESAAGSQREIGKKILATLDDYDKFLPEKQAIDNALDNMGNIDGKKIIDALKKHKVGSKLKQSKAANESIQQMIDDVAASVGKDGKISPKEAIQLRREIDDVIGDAFGKGDSGKFVNAAKSARNEIKNALLESAELSGNTEYAEAMKTLAKKMDLQDRLKGFVGKSKNTQEERIQGFVDNLFGKNKENRQDVIRDLGELFGEDFLEESKLARLASELGPEGKASLIPRQSTGRAFIGTAGPQIAVGSPTIASKVTLPAAKIAEDFAGAVSDMTPLRPISGISQAVTPKEEEEDKKRKLRSMSTGRHF